MFNFIKRVYYESVDTYEIQIGQSELDELNKKIRAKGFDVSPITEDELKYFIQNEYSFESSKRNDCYISKLYYNKGETDPAEYDLFLTTIVGEYICGLIDDANYDTDYLTTIDEETDVE